MDTKTLVNSLRTLFSDENKIEKKYTKVWLNRIYALGFHDTKRFELSVQYDKPISNQWEEWQRIFRLLRSKIQGSTRISKLDLHYSEDEFDNHRCHCEDIMIYDAEKDPA